MLLEFMAGVVALCTLLIILYFIDQVLKRYGRR